MKTDLRGRESVRPGCARASPIGRITRPRVQVETFLLESIETVKVEIGRRRAEEERSAQQRSGRLPALGSAGRQSNLPNSADERVDIRELTWEDRERVLRLLFSKGRCCCCY